MRFLLCGVLFLSCCVSASQAVANPRNLILIIGDGFDDQHVTMGRNYLFGMQGELVLDSLPYRASVQIETVSDEG